MCVFALWPRSRDGAIIFGNLIGIGWLRSAGDAALTSILAADKVRTLGRERECHMSGWQSFVDAHRELIGFVILLHVAGFWIMLVMGFIWRRQVRCLHFCFFGISDWGIRKLQEVIGYYIEEHVERTRLFSMQQWEAKVDYYFSLQKRAFVRVPKDNHVNYIMEDSRS
jgi:hypothetical protein